MSAFWHVINAESFKLVRKRRTYVLAFLWWLLLPSLALIIGRVLVSNLGAFLADAGTAIDPLIQNLASPFGIARVALVGPAFTSPPFYTIVVVALAATLIGEERSHHMWKSVLTTQPSRTAVLAGKVAIAMLFLGVLMGGALVSGILFGAFGTLFLPTTFEGDWGGLANLFVLQWSFSAALVAFALLMMHLARNLAVGVILAFFLPALLEGLYTVYAAVVGFQPINRFNVFLQTIRMRQVLEDLPAYFFGANVFAPARAPFRELAAEITGGATTGPDLGTLIGTGITLERAAWVVAGYAALLLALLAWRFLRSDID